MPERNMSSTKPNSFKSSRAPFSGTTQPNPLRPTIMPATISPTTIGTASRPRTDESSSGTRNASMTTISSGANECASFMKKLKPFAKGTQSGNYYNYFRDAQDHLCETPVFSPQSLQLRALLEPVSRYFKLCLCSDHQQVFATANTSLLFRFHLL